MRMIRKLIAAAALLLGTTAGKAQAPAEPELTAIVGADVLPMTGRAERLRDQTILLRAGRIESLGPRARIRVPAAARRIEARGMTLMPGLVDMHVHLAPVPGESGDAAQRALAVMLAHGVTTARGMAGSPNNLVVRGRIESGALAGPRFYAAAPGLNLGNTASPEAARAAVRAARAAGYDLVKSHHLVDPAIWQAVQDEARAQRLPVAGHVANPIGLERAMAAGQQVEHLDGVLFALLPEGAPERRIDFAQIPPPPVMAAAAALGDAEIAALARRVRAAGSWHVPTLALFEKIADVGASTDALRARPEMRYVPPPVLGQWAQQRQGLLDAGFTPEQGRAFRDRRRRIVRAFHRAGVPLMAGSDTAQAFHLWGPGLIDEIEALHAAGLSPIDALRSATVVPRDYFRSLPNGGSGLGWRADFGTVEPGARADLILVRGDPAADLSLLRRPEYVIAAGRVHDRAALDRMLEAAAAAAGRVN
ncbi:MAG TPA: amidohydrolase family protein [Allosphingosinicella sp.]